jgi:hypothetical protein
MAGKNEVLLTFAADSTQLERALGRVEGQTSKTSSKFQRFARVAKVASLAIVGGFVVGAKMAVANASDLDESLNKANQTFGKSGSAVTKWSKDSAKALGLSRAAALEGAASLGAMLTPMGVAPAAASKMSMRMTQLASDMASFNNEDPTDMLDRIRAGLSGESEPLKKFGAVLSDARVKAFAYANGIGKVGTELTDGQKIQARYGLLLKDTTKQHGDFARTSDGVANQQRILKAQVTNLTAELGSALLPALSSVAGMLSTVLGWLSKHQTTTQVLIGVVGGLAAGVLAVSAATKVWSAANLVLGVTMRGIPIFAIISAIALLAAGVIYAYKHSTTFRNIVDGAFKAVKVSVDAVKTAITAVVNTIIAAKDNPVVKALQLYYVTQFKLVVGAVRLVISAIEAIIDAVQAVRNSKAMAGVQNAFGNAWSAIKSVINTVADAIQNVMNKVSAATSAIGGLLSKAKGIGGFKLTDLVPHANGGIVTSPTPALIGEAGPEAVIPLNRPARAAEIMRQAGLSGVGGGVTINVNGMTVANETDIDRIATLLARKISMAGAY